MDKYRAVPISLLYGLFVGLITFVAASKIYALEQSLNDHWDAFGVIDIFLSFGVWILSHFIAGVVSIIAYVNLYFGAQKKWTKTRWGILLLSTTLFPLSLAFIWVVSYQLRTDLPDHEVKILETIFDKKSSMLDSPCGWADVDCEVRNGTLRVVSLYLYTEEWDIRTIPTTISELRALEQLYLRPGFPLTIDGLEGNIPPEIFSLENLQILDIEGMEFSGSIPIEIGQLQNLRQLSLSNCHFTGQIPHEIGLLTRLEELDLRGNQLSGPLPDTIYSLPNLKSINVGSNLLEGGISPDISKLQNLERLYIRQNSFNGRMPETILNLPNLQSVGLVDSGLCLPDTSSFRRWKSDVVVDVQWRVVEWCE